MGASASERDLCRCTQRGIGSHVHQPGSARQAPYIAMQLLVIDDDAWQIDRSLMMTQSRRMDDSSERHGLLKASE